MADPQQSLEQLLRTLESAEETCVLHGLLGSAPAYLLAQWIQQTAQKHFLVVTSNSRDLNRMAQELEFYLNGVGADAPPVHRFPPLDTLPYFQISPHRDILAQRASTLSALLHGGGPHVVVTSIAALAAPVLSPQELREKQQVLREGQLSDRDILVSLLQDWGYQKTPLVEDRGTFAVRGGIVDLWGPLDVLPWRIEFFGDTIESIRRFEPRSQSSKGKLTEAALVPVRELLWDEETRKSLAEAFVKRSDEVGLKATEKREFAEKIRSGILFGGIEHLLPLMRQRVCHLDAYFSEETYLVLQETTETQSHLEDLKSEVVVSHKQTTSVERTLYPDEVFDERILEAKGMQRFQQFHFNSWPSLAGPQYAVSTESNEDLRAELKKHTESPLKQLSQQLVTWREGHRIILLASSAAQQRRMLDLFAPYEVPLRSDIASLSEAMQIVGPHIPIIVGDLGRGFRWPAEHLIVITDEEIFGPKARRQSKGPTSQESFLTFGSLKEGDPLVHEEHGIGLYRGMTRLALEDLENDFLVIEYAKGDKLYVPVYRMNQVQPYQGGVKNPRLDKLGGTSWQKVRSKAQKVIRQMAGELLNLYAARAAGKGVAFSPRNEIFEAFEASFPYEETADQARTIDEVIKDMESSVPMDRLVLGDVGYGKTEVALRAAFKAALDGKQSLMLVPTTVLAFQHYRTFKERFQDYPVRVGLLSRFQKRQETKEILARLSAGDIDIIIGTHRLLQADVSPKDLGLLIIDEEHRFGVSHKEKIKQLKKSVDVLVLSATPIPRTLNMALTGLRGISVIETPPTDRLAIRTYVVPYTDEVVREAVEREIKRGGQVFYVHNRVQDIEKIRQRLESIFPNLSIGVAHGQMAEGKLEQAMIAFANKKYDILLCTTIIESGIDIPTANTILIERADGFGLAQVYQLRGRVGRGAQRAYAYLLYSPREAMTPDARKRLSVLQRFSELGSGFKLACHDLEIRGAGNLLGVKQSGQLEAIGYDLYVELLDQAIRELQGEEVLESIEPELHLKVTAGIPEEYVPDPPLRLDLYRRLAAMKDEETSYAIEEEMIDRFGPLPNETVNFLQLMMVKVLAKQLRMRTIHYNRDQFIYSFDGSTPLSPEILMAKLGSEPDKYRLTPEMKLIVREEASSEQERLVKPREFLRELLTHVMH